MYDLTLSAECTLQYVLPKVVYLLAWQL